MFRVMFSRRWWWTTLIVLAGIGLTIRLGFWQVDRYRINKTFDDHLAAMQSAAPLAITGASGAGQLPGMDYRPATAMGVFDFVHQFAVRNQIWVQSWGNATGYILVTPLVLPDGSALLVDRGWIPLTDDTPESWSKYDEPGQVHVTGILRRPVKPEMGGVPDPTLTPGEPGFRFWNLIDLDRLQKQIPYPLLPVYLERGPDENQTDPPFRALPVPDGSETGNNVGYAAMWFSFAALLFFGYPVYLRKQSIVAASH
jgi:surfeit locus 1 family protein